MIYDPCSTTLKIHRYNQATGSWEALSNCIVDTSAKTVSCQTAQFSDIGLFGEENNSFTRESNYRKTLSLVGIASVVFAFIMLKRVKMQHRRKHSS